MAQRLSHCKAREKTSFCHKSGHKRRAPVSVHTSLLGRVTLGPNLPEEQARDKGRSYEKTDWQIIWYAQRAKSVWTGEKQSTVVGSQGSSDTDHAGLWSVSDTVTSCRAHHHTFVYSYDITHQNFMTDVWLKSS